MYNQQVALSERKDSRTEIKNCPHQPTECPVEKEGERGSNSNEGNLGGKVDGLQNNRRDERVEIGDYFYSNNKDERKNNNFKSQRKEWEEKENQLSSMFSHIRPPQQSYRSSPVNSEGLQNPSLAAALVSSKRTIQNVPFILSFPQCSVLNSTLLLLSNLVEFFPVLSCPALFFPILSYPVLSYHVLPYSFLSYLNLSGTFLFSHVLSSPILSCPILSYLIMSYHIISYHMIT